MRLRFATTLLALGLLGFGAVAQQRSTPQPFRGSAESAMLGIRLFDTGQSVIAKYGSPMFIEALNIGTAGGGAGAAGGTQGGGRSGPAGPAQQGGGGGQPQASIDLVLPGDLSGGFVGDPFDTGSVSRQQAPSQPQVNQAGTGGSGVEATARDQGQGRGGASGSIGGSGSLVTFTRWVYTRAASRYAFVLDNHNRVVQIEAVGLEDSRPTTRRGIRFGCTFGRIINAYGDPDGYEINGENIVVRYLRRGNVAFRLQRVEANKPHLVTGIVIAAGS